MQNNIVLTAEQEALKNANLTQGVATHIPGEGHLHHHHHAHGTGVQGVPLTTTQGLVGTGVQGVPLTTTEGLVGHHHHHVHGTGVQGVPLTTTQGLVGTGVPLTTTEGLVGHHHHHHVHGTGVQGVPLTTAEGLVGGNYISAPGTVITDQQFVGGNIPLTCPYAHTFANTGVTGGVPLGTNLTGTELLGAGALGAGVTGAGLVGAHHHHHGVTTTTTGLAPTTGLTTTTGLAPNTALAGTGLGTFIFRPLEGKFLKDKDPIGKMDCYCKFKIGFHSGKSSVAKSEGTHPVWNDVISLNRKHNEQFAKLKIKDKDRLTLNDKVGEVKIPLNEVALKGRVQQWFNVYKKEQLAGEILLDIEYQPRTVF